MSLYNASPDLLKAIRDIVSEDREKYYKEQQDMDKLVAEKMMNKKKPAHDPVGKEDADIDNDGDTDKSDSYLHNRRKAIKSAMKEEHVEENKDTPGNSYDHQCAIHVKHSKLGEGRTLFSQHADPDQNGNIAWYDVMFEHGIEKNVMTTDLEVLVSEGHMSHKKKKGM